MQKARGSATKNKTNAVFVQYGVRTELLAKFQFLYDMTSYRFVAAVRSRLLFTFFGRSILIWFRTYILKMGVESSSDIFVNIYQSTRRHVLKDNSFM
jgi:hypothetical protein